MKKKAGQYINFSRKKLPLLIVLFLIGVLLLVISSFIPSGQRGRNVTGELPVVGKEQESTADPVDSSVLAKAEREMENRLEAILSTIEGVGSVSVSITLENGPEYIYAVNENINESKIEEKDNSGGHRITTETTNSDQMVLAQPADMGGGQQPVVVKEIKPKIAGVLVAAEGADNAETRINLSRAVQTVLNIPAHKVSVLQKNIE
ncbi:MAG: stage III sporulation protein AG [Bacillota bacterium]